jgi:hypothetical protein
VNIYNIKTARMSDEEDKPEILAIEKSPASTGVEQKKKKLKKGVFNREWLKIIVNIKYFSKNISLIHLKQRVLFVINNFQYIIVEKLI